jgi:alkanesulfonate monooxygenase SsuD/methylene tetrahydromethanopterin reductase-like flavin-dependent oxidoreductase (luciferase family)
VRGAPPRRPRVGVVLLPQGRWAHDRLRWQRAEAYGFDSALTYDHLSWRDLAGEPWFATVPTLVAAATATTRVRLGTWVASPNYRHPVPFAKELMTLDDMSGGRLVLGVGAGGAGHDARVLGSELLPARDRARRFSEFVQLLDLLLTADRVSYAGEHYRAVDARMLPGCVQRPRLPFVVAANGPRTMAVAARYGQGWATTGSTPPEDGPRAWWRGVAALAARLDDVCASAGRDPSTLERWLSVDASGTYSLASLGAFTDAYGQAAALGFAEVVVHWPRAAGAYAGSEGVLEEVAAWLAAARPDPDGVAQASGAPSQHGS